MTPDISYFIISSLVETDRYIEVADGKFVSEKETGEVQIKMCKDIEKLSLLCYITYCWHQTCAINYVSIVC